MREGGCVRIYGREWQRIPSSWAPTSGHQLADRAEIDGVGQHHRGRQFTTLETANSKQGFTLIPELGRHHQADADLLDPLTAGQS